MYPVSPMYLTLIFSKKCCIPVLVSISYPTLTLVSVPMHHRCLHKCMNKFRPNWCQAELHYIRNCDYNHPSILVSSIIANTHHISYKIICYTQKYVSHLNRLKMRCISIINLIFYNLFFGWDRIVINRYNKIDFVHNILIQ